MLHEFIEVHREEIIRRCRANVAARSIPPPTEAEVTHGVPLFLDQLVQVLLHGLSSSPEMRGTAVLRGHDLLLQGFTVSQVVHDYGDVCQSITQLALELDAPISTEDFRALNGCLDDAIAAAVTEYGRERTQAGIDGESLHGSEQLAFVAHELRNLTNTAMLAFEVLKTGNVGVAGSTGAVLQRSLRGIDAIVGRSLAGVRITEAGIKREPFLVSGFIKELTPAATIEAIARGVTLTVLPVEAGIIVLADRQVLAAVLGNLLQNAFQFTQPCTVVTLRVHANADRVFMDIEDTCGGLPGDDLDKLFRPLEQRTASRTGLGLGLAFSRWGVEANDGRLYARDVPGKGCIFTVDLPRLPVPAVLLPSF